MHPFAEILRFGKHISICSAFLATLSLPTYGEEQATPESAPSQAQTILKFTNGNQLSGDSFSLDQKQLWLSSDILSHPTAFSLDHLLSVSLPKPTITPRQNNQTHIKFHPRFRELRGDTLTGSLQSITPDHVTLQTSYGGTINAKRNLIQSIQIFSSQQGYYNGPNSKDEWVITPEESWKFRNNTLASQSQGTIGYNTQLPEKSHLSLDLKWQRSMRFRLFLYTNSITAKLPYACYDIAINRNYAYMTTRGKITKPKKTNASRWQQIQPPDNTTHAHFDFFTNRTTGVVTIFIDKIHAGELQSISPNPSDLGTGLSIQSYYKCPITISNIRIKPWNGLTLPKARDPEQATPDHSHSRITLVSGKKIPFTTCHVEKNNLIIDHNKQIQKIKFKEIDFITVGSSGEQPKKYRDDVRAWFHHGGHVILKLSSIKDGKIHGSSQAIGDVTFDLSAFNRLDFQIYDKKANELRKESR